MNIFIHQLNGKNILEYDIDQKLSSLKNVKINKA